MKPNFFLLLLLTLVFNTTLNAQSQISVDQLIGTWTFDYDTSREMMTQQSKDYYERIDITRQNRIKNKYQDRKVIFKQDGTYLQTLSNGQNIIASWSINEHDEIKITKANGNVNYQIIKELETDKLVLNRKNTLGGNVNLLFTDWYLIKN